MRIVIDPGHGGKDPGAIGPGGTREADVNFPLALYLQNILSRAGAEVKLTRLSALENPSLSQRGRIAADWKADLFLSLHCNGAANPEAKGVECYYSVDLPETKQFAADLSAAVADVLGTKDRGARVRESKNYPGEDYYTVIDTAQDGGVPVVLLLEAGFITNAEEEAKLRDPAMQLKLAQVIAAVVTDYTADRLRSDATGPETGPAAPNTGTPILGEAVATVQQARAWLQQKAPDWTLMADLYYSIAPKYGIRPDVALAQACKETGYFRFGGLVQPEQNNFAGLGATGPGNPGASFPDRATGVEAHIQHLYAYASKEPLPAGVQKVDPRFDLVKRGTAPYVEYLGAAENPAGVGWAYPGKDYGHSIVRDYLTPMLAVEVADMPTVDSRVEELRLQVRNLQAENEQLRKQAEAALSEVARKRGAFKQIATIAQGEAS